jgi:hypothetical protein
VMDLWDMQIIPDLAIISKTRRLITVKEINTIRDINYLNQLSQGIYVSSIITGGGART